MEGGGTSGCCHPRRRIHIAENKESGGGGGGGSGLERLPTGLLLNEILQRLDLESLCSLSCVNRAMRFYVSQALPLLSSLHLAGFPVDDYTLSLVTRRCSGLRSAVLNCLRLDDLSVAMMLGPNIVELSLLSCSRLSYQVLAAIGEKCPNLGLLMVEFADWNSPGEFTSYLIQLLKGCLHLESLSLKIRGIEANESPFERIEFFLPQTIKSLKLHPVLEQHSVRLINELGKGRNFLETINTGQPLSPLSSGSKIQCLSLVLDVISDGLIISITKSLPLLVELDLEDRPTMQPWLQQDLTNTGLHSLASCHRLRSLSLLRNRQNNPSVSFKRVNDMGMFLLSEGCKFLESVTFCGFSRVSDAGFASVLHSCQNLKKFEVRNAFWLSDLAFHDLTGAPCSLVEVRLLSCNLITSDTVNKLACSRSLEVLDLCGCRSVADACLNSISCLNKLTMLNLAGADVTDSGLSVLGQGSPPLTRLSLRGCKRVTDKGVSFLLRSEGTIGKTLSVLDLGYMPGITDKAVQTIAACGLGIMELCIRYCFYVTDYSIEVLAKKGSSQDGSTPIQRLDLCNCTGLSVESLGLLKRPSFRRLQWLGVGQTRWTSKRDSVLSEIFFERPWLALCLDGCEMGCYDGWQFHRHGCHRF